MTSTDSNGAPGMDEHASPEELAAYALDSSLLATARREHIATCPVCQHESAWLREAVADLDATPQCPDSETLVAFALGRASADEQLDVAAHLRTCDICAEEVELTRATLRPSVEEESGFVAAVRRVVATLVLPPLAPNVRATSEQQASDSTAAAETYAAEASLISVRVEREGDALVLSGILQGPSAQASSGQQAPAERVALLYRQEQVDLSGGPRLVDSAQLTPYNAFTFYAVPTGVYRLDVAQGETVVTIDPIVVSEDTAS